MLKNIAIATNLIACLTGIPLANAAGTCIAIGGMEPGRLVLADQDACQQIGNALAATGAFPDIFTDPSHPKLAGVCYLSDPSQKLQLTYNGEDVEVSTKSAWVETESAQAQAFPFVRIITEMKLFHPGEAREFAKINTRETLDPASAIEESTVTGGTKTLFGAKGALTIASHVDPAVPVVPGTQIPYWVDIAAVKGMICQTQ